VIIPQHFRDIGHPHRSAWMTGIRRLNSIHTERTNSICEIAPGRLASG
jgi:hypothetical protein